MGLFGFFGGDKEFRPGPAAAPQFYTVAQLRNFFIDEQAAIDDFIAFTFNCESHYLEIGNGYGSISFIPSENGRPPEFKLYTSGDGIRYGDLMRFLDYLGREYGEDSIWRFACYYDEQNNMLIPGHMFVDFDEYQPAHYIISAEIWFDTAHSCLEVPGPGVFAL